MFIQIRDKQFAEPAVLVLLTFLAAILRIYKLGYWSFWPDEFLTITHFYDWFNGSLLRDSLSHTLIRLATDLFGISELSSRLVPATFGILTVPLLFILAKHQFGMLVAIVAALLLALSPWHLFFSQSARYPVALLFFYTLTLFLFFSGIEEDRPLALIFALFFLALAIKERFTAFFFLPVAGTYILSLLIFPFPKPAGLNWRNLAILLVPTSIVGIFFALPYLTHFDSQWMGGSLGVANRNAVVNIGAILYRLGVPIICVATATGIACTINRDRAGFYLLLSSALPVLILVAISPIHRTFDRYVFLTLTSWLCLCAIGCTMLLKKNVAADKIIGIGVLLALTLSFAVNAYYYFNFQNGNRPMLKETSHYILSQQRPQDIAVVGFQVELAKHYGLKNVYSIVEIDATKLDRVAARGQRIWFQTLQLSDIPDAQIRSWIEDNAQEVKAFDVPHIVNKRTSFVYLYEPVSP